jgi:hypothetical protein
MFYKAKRFEKSKAYFKSVYLEDTHLSAVYKLISKDLTNAETEKTKFD